MMRKCINCGADFAPYGNKQYCSDRCREIIWHKKNNAKKKKAAEPKKCLNCGILITSKRRTKFCSDSCNKKYYAPKKPKQIKKCVNCGKEFTTHYSRSEYCMDRPCRLAQQQKHNLKARTLSETRLHIPDWVEGETEKCAFCMLPVNMSEAEKLEEIKLLRRIGWSEYQKRRRQQYREKLPSSSTIDGFGVVHY